MFKINLLRLGLSCYGMNRSCLIDAFFKAKGWSFLIVIIRSYSRS